MVCGVELLQLSACAKNWKQALCPLFGPGNEMKLDFYTKLTRCLVVLSRIELCQLLTQQQWRSCVPIDFQGPPGVNNTTWLPSLPTLQYATPYVTITKPHCPLLRSTTVFELTIFDVDKLSRTHDLILQFDWYCQIQWRWKVLEIGSALMMVCGDMLPQENF